MTKLFIITGEHSGELHASGIVRYLKENYPDCEIEGIGGSNLSQAGAKLFCNHERMSAAGLSLKIIKEHFQLGKNILNYLKNDYKPDVVLLVDYGGFNLKIAKYIKSECPNTKILYFIPPQIWASRKWRIKSVKKYIDKVLYIFPFEKELYEENGIDCEFVGHPLVRELSYDIDRTEFFKQINLHESRKLISIFPGSRTFEIKMLMPVLIKSAELIHKKLPDIQFVLCQSPNIKDELLSVYRIPKWIKVVKGYNYELLSLSDALILASGTVALEAALYGTPMVICYKAPYLLYSIYLLVRCIKMVSLPNIILNKEVVPELIQMKCKKNIIADFVCKLIWDKSYSQKMKEELYKLKDKLGEKNTFEAVAKNIIK